MQQLNLFETPPGADDAPVWTSLDDEQQTTVVMKLAALIAKTILPPDQETDDE